MEKIKSLTLFTLLLAIAIVTYQMYEYKNISMELLKELRIEQDKLSSSKIENSKLQEQIDSLTNSNKQLHEQILSLEENLTCYTLKEMTNLDVNYTTKQDPLILDVDKFEENESEKIDIPIIPNIIIDKENKEITGIELKYEQKF